MKALRNSYLLMRHGESQANVAGLIVSTPEQGCDNYGLSPEGRRQITRSLDQYQGPVVSKVLCSDFLRTRQTAAQVCEYWSMADPQREVRLRERHFGDLESEGDSLYARVWEQDQQQHPSDWQVETPEAVQARARELIMDLEQQYHQEVILLVSHGDLLQILRTAFSGCEAYEHRSLSHHQTAQILPLASAGDTIPRHW